MAKSGFELKINKKALEELKKQAVEASKPQLQEIVDDIRAHADGKSADKIASELSQRIKAVGGTATPSELQGWAQQIASGGRVVFLP